MAQHDQIEKAAPHAAYDEDRVEDKLDDIHVAAIADDPEVAQVPSLATILSIFVCYQNPPYFAKDLLFTVSWVVDHCAHLLWLHRGHIDSS